MKRPRIIIPIGDPAGIGPEIVVKALASKEVQKTADCLVAGDKNILEKAMEWTGVSLKIHNLEGDGEPDPGPGVLNLIDLDNMDMDQYQCGQISGMCGKAAYGYIEKSIRLALDGRADAVATAPINKESLKAGDIPYIGHTEIFGALTNTSDPLTMFETDGMRIFFLTRHLSLRKMLDQIKKDSIINCAVKCFDALDRLGVKNGTMAVAGLNPHCGEHGLFGYEEVEEIMPAVDALRKMGYSVEGPVGADSVFHQAKMGRYDCVLSLYHDQGHIAAKTLDFDRTISVTNGMPILRTSVDHGTAFDSGGTGKASEVSMIEAIKLAAKYAPLFKKS